MKVFISHAFGEEDERLGSMLKGDLDAAGMEGYMAEMTPQYNLLIADKIRQEIGGSDWLVAIVTERGRASASVHEEIGYALGKGVEVVLMLKKDVKEAGVLVHGREPLVFTNGEFKKSSLAAAEFIKNAPRPTPRRHTVGKTATDLLEKRHLQNVESPDFAKNRHFPYLYSGSLSDAEKPVVLFTACPHDLADRHDVTSPEFARWVESNTNTEVDGRRVRMLGTEFGVDIGTLLAVEKRSAAHAKNTTLYREFQSSGFLEWGTSSMFFSRDDSGRAELHLCYMIGEFWTFLASARLFYKKIGLDAPLTVLVSIRNSRGLGLGNYGDRTAGDTWISRDPATRHDHIQLPHVFGSVREMTDEGIASLARRTAKHVCNAYGETTPNCYNADGSFAWGVYSMVARKSGGYRL